MSFVSVPISLQTVNERSMPMYLDSIRKAGAQRVFLFGLGNVFADLCMIRTDPKRVETAIRYFKENGLEVGIWVNAFGHGRFLNNEEKQFDRNRYVSIEGLDGRRMIALHSPNRAGAERAKFMEY